jgi:hypothetical protein
MMRITCPQCGFFRELPDNKIPVTSTMATCPKCRHRFKFRYDATDPANARVSDAGYAAGGGEEAASSWRRQGTTSARLNHQPLPAARWEPEETPEDAAAQTPAAPSPRTAPVAASPPVEIPSDPTALTPPAESAPQPDIPWPSRRSVTPASLREPMPQDEPETPPAAPPRRHDQRATISQPPLLPDNTFLAAPEARPEPETTPTVSPRRHDRRGAVGQASLIPDAEETPTPPVRPESAPPRGRDIRESADRSPLPFENEEIPAPPARPVPEATPHTPSPSRDFRESVVQTPVPPDDEDLLAGSSAAPRTDAGAAPETDSPKTSPDRNGAPKQGPDGVRDIWARLQAMDDAPARKPVADAPTPDRNDDRDDGDDDRDEARDREPVTDPIPWERQDAYGFLPGLFLTLKKILFQPMLFFQSMPEGRPKGKALVFNLLISEFLLVIDFLWSLMGLRAKFGNTGQSDVMTAFSNSPSMAFLLALLLIPLALSVGIYLDAWLTHLLLLLFRSAKKGFNETFRVLCYSAAPTVLSAVPVAGQILSPVILVWYMALQAIGLKKAHEGAYTQTLAAIFIKWSLYLFVLLAMLQSFAPGR